MSLWTDCLAQLERELSEQEFTTWIRPLHPVISEKVLVLVAPNRFVFERIRYYYEDRINALLLQSNDSMVLQVMLGDDTRHKRSTSGHSVMPEALLSHQSSGHSGEQSMATFAHHSGLNPKFVFESFVEGKSNQLALATAKQVARSPGKDYNPLFLYGGVGLGKTHLMHAIGNAIIGENPNAKVVYLYSERFVADMVNALQHNRIEQFKQYYRSVDVLLIDDIQFFSGKDRSQEEFFHTFNALLEGRQQVIMTCDRYPKEIHGVEERLKSRFGWGLTVAIDPPDLETRVAILMNKAAESSCSLTREVAFFVAKKVRSNVRELEGALRRIVARAQFMQVDITVSFVRDTLKDLIHLQNRQITVENIQKTVAEYCKIKLSDLLSKRRSRQVARPRQMAMSLAKELTNRSLVAIGEAFGGRDHTTVLHACRTIDQLKVADASVEEDYSNLLRILST